MRYILAISFALLFISSLSSQSYLQLETINDPISVKYPVNSRITFKSTSLDEWQTRRIQSFIVKDSVVIFDDGFYTLRQFSEVQTYRPMACIVCKGLFTFGSSWMLFGVIDEVYSPGRQFTKQTAAIGLTSMIVGYGINKFFFKRKHKLGTRYRLRLLNLSMN